MSSRSKTTKIEVSNEETDPDYVYGVSIMRAFTVEINSNSNVRVWFFRLAALITGVKVQETTVHFRCGKWHEGRNCKIDSHQS